MRPSMISSRRPGSIFEIKNRPVSSVWPDNEVSPYPLSISSLTLASGLPLRSKTWPANAVTPSAALSGGRSSQSERGLPFLSFPFQAKSSSPETVGFAEGVVDTGFSPVPVDGSRGVDIPPGMGLVEKLSPETGSINPFRSIAPLTDTAYVIPGSKSDSGLMNAKDPFSAGTTVIFSIPFGPLSDTV